jgi:hypothetical protein
MYEEKLEQYRERKAQSEKRKAQAENRKAMTMTSYVKEAKSVIDAEFGKRASARLAAAVIQLAAAAMIRGAVDGLGATNRDSHVR